MNPFEVLQLKPNATEEEIVQQAGRLRQRSTDEQTLSQIRQAVQQLTASSEERELHRWLTFQEPEHDWSAITRLMNAHRRPPSGDRAEVKRCPPLDLKEIARMLQALLSEELKAGPLPFTSPPIEELPEDIDRQTVEALWQALRYDPRT